MLSVDVVKALANGRRLQILAWLRLADPQLLGDEQPAHPVPDQVAVDLGREVRSRVLEAARASRGGSR